MVFSKGLSLKNLYEFDLCGYTIIRNFLTNKQVRHINAILDKAHEGEFIVKFEFLHLDLIFMDLLSDPRVLAVCEQLMGKWFRFDHAFGYQQIRPFIGKAKIENLHGGLMAEQGGFQYFWYGNRPYCGQVQFGFVMHPVKKGDGGLIFVPGSHKQNIPLTGIDVYYKILKGDLEEWWVHNPVLNAGDLVIFNEAVIHGTKLWKSDHPRRILYYKYCPGYMAWADYSQTQKYVVLARNNLERRIMRGPYVGRYKPRKPRWEDEYRTPTVFDVKSSVREKIMRAAKKANAQKLVKLFYKKFG